MGDKSAIEWTEATWNPLTGCTRVSAGCDNCYAARQAATRLKDTEAYRDLAVITPSGRPAFNGKIRLLPDRLDQPLRWRKPRRIFVNSMSDLFHPDVPVTFIYQVFAAMALADWHVYQVLTKRPERAAAILTRRYLPGAISDAARLRFDAISTEFPWPLPNVWLGTSVEDQPAADERIPHLLRTPAAVRFLSCEPLLGPVDLSRIGYWRDEPLSALEEIVGHVERPCVDWVIVGGESGPGARGMDVGWAEDLVEQCREAGVACFVKQLGAHPYRAPRGAGTTGYYLAIGDRKGGDPAEWPQALRVREYPRTAERS